MPFRATLPSLPAAQVRSHCWTQPSWEMGRRLSCSTAQPETEGGSLILNAAPEQSRGTCAKACCSSLWSRTPTACLSWLWAQATKPQGRRVLRALPEWGRPTPSYSLLKTPCPVCLILAQHFIVSWSFSVTCATKDSNMYLLLDLKQTISFLRVFFFSHVFSTVLVRFFSM